MLISFIFLFVFFALLAVFISADSIDTWRLLHRTVKTYTVEEPIAGEQTDIVGMSYSEWVVVNDSTGLRTRYKSTSPLKTGMTLEFINNKGHLVKAANLSRAIPTVNKRALIYFLYIIALTLGATVIHILYHRDLPDLLSAFIYIFISSALIGLAVSIAQLIAALRIYCSSDNIVHAMIKGYEDDCMIGSYSYGAHSVTGIIEHKCTPAIQERIPKGSIKDVHVTYRGSLGDICIRTGRFAHYTISYIVLLILSLLIIGIAIISLIIFA